MSKLRSMKGMPNEAAAMRNHDALIAEHPWIIPSALKPRIDAVMTQNSSARSKRSKLFKIIDEAAAAIYPHSACDAGCSHCCKTTVMIHQSEADAIGEFLGKSVQRVPMRHPESIRALGYGDKYLGVPCPILVDGKCSAYEVRPYVCRQQHSLDDTPDQCDMEKFPSSESSVPHFNLKYLELAMAHVAVQAGDAIGDIREFFPG